jgi:hypothetical protein
MWVCHSRFEWNLPHSFEFSSRKVYGQMRLWMFWMVFRIIIGMSLKKWRKEEKLYDCMWNWCGNITKRFGCAFMFVILAALMLEVHQRHDSVCNLLPCQHSGDLRYSESFFNGDLKHYVLSRYVSFLRINRKMIQTLFCMPSSGCLCVCVCVCVCKKVLNQEFLYICTH